MAVRKLHHLERMVAEGRDDWMIPTLRKQDYITPLVGAGLAALSAQLDRARNHDDVAILLLPEAELLLAKRGHHSRFYTDELASLLLETIDGVSYYRTRQRPGHSPVIRDLGQIDVTVNLFESRMKDIRDKRAEPESLDEYTRQAFHAWRQER